MNCTISSDTIGNWLTPFYFFQGYDISFLITNYHCEDMHKHKLIDFIVQFMEVSKGSLSLFFPSKKFSHRLINEQPRAKVSLGMFVASECYRVC